MKIKISDEEVKNVLASCNKDDLQSSCEGTFKKFNVERVKDGYELEYIYDANGNLKPQFAKNTEGGKDGTK